MLSPICADFALADTSRRFFNLSEINPLKNLNKLLTAGNPSILIFGADADTRLLLRATLERKNYEINEAENLYQSVASAEICVPDVVLLDTTLDYAKGFAELQTLRENELFDRAKFIVLSGHAQPKIRQSAFEAGADDFWLKPIDFDRLDEKIRVHLKNRRNLIF